MSLAETIFQAMLRDAILGLSVYLVLYTGMFSLANAGFMSIGAYTSTILVKSFGVPLEIGLAAGMLLAALLAIPISLPLLRLKDIYLAIATIGFGEVVRVMLLNADPLLSSILGRPVTLTNGASGIINIPTLTRTWHMILFLVIVSYIIVRLHRSRFGLAMAAIRQDESAAANVGINIVYVKCGVFMLSAMLAAAAGVFDAHMSRVIEPRHYGFTRAVDILAFAVLGGTSTWLGPIVGGMTLSALPELLRGLKELRGIFTGIVLLAVIIYLPNGLINPTGWRRLWENFKNRARTSQDHPHA